jgi:hypothetical protein
LRIPDVTLPEPEPEAFAAEQELEAARQRKVEAEPKVDKIDPTRELARSPAARRGLWTRWALGRRIRRVRDLLHAWNDLGEFLLPCKRLTRTSEAQQLRDLLHEVTDLLRKFPPILCRPGQPGFLVLSLTEHEGVRTFQALDAGQRTAIKEDWDTARKLLLAHCEYLSEQIAAQRGLTRWQRFTRTIACSIREQPYVALFLLALLAVNIALWRTYILDWHRTHRTTPTRSAPPPPSHEKSPR